MAVFSLTACSLLETPEESVELAPAQEVVETSDEAEAVVAEPDVEAETVVEAEAAEEVVAVEPMEEVVVEEPAEAEAMTVAYSGPDWAALPLTNARTGEAFTLADFAGKVVFVEPMATWCSNCRAQQRTVNGVIPQVDGEQYVFISLSVEPGLADSRLASYADQNGFDQIFAVATPELTSALVQQFGRGVTTPPATPHFTLAPDGTVSSLRDRKSVV